MSAESTLRETMAQAVQLLEEGRVLLFGSRRAEGAPLYRVSLEAVLQRGR